MDFSSSSPIRALLSVVGLNASQGSTRFSCHGPRQLNTLVQRVEVIRIFATSKLWYKASALPLPTKFAKKFESAIFRFLWIGKLKKLKLDEIKNPVLSGGLNLSCILSKADALFLTQTSRLLTYPGNK